MPRLQTISNLAFGVSHTLGNIFGAILGNVHFLRDEPGGPDTPDLLQRLESSASDGIELMRSLQYFANTPASREMRPVSLANLAEDVVDLIGELCSHWPSCRGLSLETRADGPCRAWGHAPQLRESVIGLVFNAIQATGPGGRVVVRARSADGTSELSVRDDGPGMRGEIRRRATEPFFTTRPQFHQGLGLTVARGIAVGHRGSLTLTRVRPRGLEATISLPQTPPPQDRLDAVRTDPLATVTSDRKGAVQ